MTTKNIRNASFSTINIVQTVGPTGPAGPAGVAAFYSNSGLISLTWDRDDLLQGGPYNGNIVCERIGNMLFVKILETITGTPQGANALFYSPTGIIPTDYRPSANKFTSAWVVNGYENPVLILRSNSSRNTFPGACILSSDGTLSFGASLNPLEGPVQNDGITLTPFQGPNTCGILAQTLYFNLD